MVAVSPVDLVQPHLWEAERLVLCEPPTALAAVLGRLRHAFRRVDAAVPLDAPALPLPAPLVLGPLLLFLLPLLILPLALALVVGVVVLIGALGVGAYAFFRTGARSMCYAVTDRRILDVHGSDVDWTLHEAWDDARVAWRLGSIGTVAFRRRGEGDLDVRFVAVRNPAAILALVERTARERRRR